MEGNMQNETLQNQTMQYDSMQSQVYQCSTVTNEEMLSEATLNENAKEMKRKYNKIGWFYSIFAVVVTVVQIVLSMVIPIIFGDAVKNSSWFTWFLIMVPVDMIGFPILYFLLFKQDKTILEKKKMGFWKVIATVCMSFGIMYVGNLIGTFVNTMLTLPFGVGSDSSNVLVNIMMGSDTFWRILCVGILAPIVEELIFRKLLIDRVIKYGGWFAILASALMFGLFHGNFAQFFYAFGLGMFWAFIYIRTGKVWYTILLHMIINLTNSVIAVFALSQLDMSLLEEMSNPLMYESSAFMERIMQALPGLLLFFGYTMIILAISLTGIILILCSIKKFRVASSDFKMNRKGRFAKAFFNPGMIVYYICTIALFVFYYASLILNANM